MECIGPSSTARLRGTPIKQHLPPAQPLQAKYDSNTFGNRTPKSQAILLVSQAIRCCGNQSQRADRSASKFNRIIDKS